MQTIETQILLPFEETNLRGGYRDYFIAKRSNYFTTIHTLARLWNCYLGLDEIWEREFSDLQRITQPGQALPIKLFSNCHAQFRIAFELGFSTASGKRGTLFAVQSRRRFRPTSYGESQNSL